MRKAAVLSLWLPLAAISAAEPAPSDRLAALALGCVHREYPNKIAHVLSGDDDVGPPRVLTPAFYGCFDWHSAVHGHWLLARLARTEPESSFAAPARAALSRTLTEANVAGEVRYLEGEGRATFERPYGLAWLLQLGAELREWRDPRAEAWSRALSPLERAAVGRLSAWLPKLSRPVRVGEHDQTAFALGLALDWARVARDDAFARLAGLSGSATAAPRSTWQGRSTELDRPLADLRVAVLGMERETFLVGAKLWDGGRMLELADAVAKRRGSLGPEAARRVAGLLDRAREELLSLGPERASSSDSAPSLLVEAARLCVDGHFESLRG